MRLFNILITIFILVQASTIHAQYEGSKPVQKWYTPSNIRIQYAGNTGMVSFGPSWSLLKNKVDLESSIGFVPKFDAEKPIYITAIKSIYKPRFAFNIGKASVKPFSVGFACTYTFGDRFRKYQDTNNYPKEYYWWNPSIRFGLLYQAEIYTQLKHKHLKGYSLYFESSIWDLMIVSYVANSNYKNLKISDIITLGIGTRIFF